jgi:hypothetical protein
MELKKIKHIIHFYKAVTPTELKINKTYNPFLQRGNSYGVKKIIKFLQSGSLPELKQINLSSPPIKKTPRT